MTDTEKAALQKELLATLAWAEDIRSPKCLKREMHGWPWLRRDALGGMRKPIGFRGEREDQGATLEVKVSKKHSKKTIDALWEGDL